MDRLTEEIELRRNMAMFHDDQEAFDSWVENLVFFDSIPFAQVMELAVVKQEGKQYRGRLR